MKNKILLFLGLLSIGSLGYGNITLTTKINEQNETTLNYDKTTLKFKNLADCKEYIESIAKTYEFIRAQIEMAQEGECSYNNLDRKNVTKDGIFKLLNLCNNKPITSAKVSLDLKPIATKPKNWFSLPRIAFYSVLGFAAYYAYKAFWV